MSMFGGSWKDDYLNDDDGPMFGGAERYEERKRRLERAEEISSGLSSGKFEDDDKVWELVKRMNDD